jgi:hypothetical protein
MRFANRTYVAQLLKIKQKESAALRSLKRVWPHVQSRAKIERQRLAKKIGRNDPLRLPLDLLRPIERSADENTHTRALAYLLDPDPKHGHGLGKYALIRILEAIPRRYGAAKLLRVLRRERTQVSVTPEHRYLFIDGKRRSVARCDIWIEMKHESRGAALVIIENKIDAPEGKGQLSRYEAEADRWKKHHKGHVLLIYLTREKRENGTVQGRWANLSYLDVAFALRKVWAAQPQAPGREWLSLYIATVMRHVVGIDVDRLHNTPIGQLERYLGERAS